jgi:hypothetical protein
MKGGIHFYLAGAVILLTLAGCTRGMSFAAREESYGAAEDVDDDLSSDTSEASFGPDDPGVTLITADEGGNIDRYDSMFFGPESDTTRWAIAIATRPAQWCWERAVYVQHRALNLVFTLATINYSSSGRSLTRN